MQQENYLKYTVLTTALVAACLLALYAIPEFDIGDFHFRRINLLADIQQKDTKKVAKTDTVPKIKPVFADTCKNGITCIEDFSKEHNGLDAFLGALENSREKPVRIAFFGDSYIEGDILLDPFRDSMQTLFGGSGVGFLPITSEVAGFRQTVIHSFSNWKTYSAVGERNPEVPLGPAGHVYIPLEDNRVTYRAEKNRRHLNLFPSAKIYYGQCINGSIQCFINDSTQRYTLRDGNAIQQLTIPQASTSFGFRVPASDKLALYGVSFESNTGICVDNFSMRGNSGTGLGYTTEAMYRNFDNLHPYNLVVLAYGLNVASAKAKNYDYYEKSMTQTIAMMKRAFPNSSILLVGCSDRGAKINGELQTMPMLKELIAVQEKMAADNSICFWNLFEAMGGDSTMVKWSSMKPALCNKDYTHITYHGGKKVAEILIGTLLYEKEKYDRRKKAL